MKKIYSLLSLLVAGSLSLSAQQLPNASFESWKATCGNSESFGSTTGMRVRPGVEPTDWNGSNVNQKVSGVTKEDQTLVVKTDGVNGSAVQLTNKFVGVFSIGSVAPGYITFGTPWVHAVTTVSKCDGGTYGGISFTNRPDAISGKFKRTDTNSEVSRIIFYSWTGTFKSYVGEKDNPGTSNEREDVDRAILARSNAYLSANSSGTLISTADHSFTSTNSDWQTITVPIEYKNNLTPQKCNVVISSGDYWTRTNMVKETQLLVDDMTLLYYSRLASLSVNGSPVAGFNSDTYTYTIDTEMPAESAFAYTTLGNSGSGRVAISLDTENAIATLTVTNVNAGGTDVDGQTQHVYTLQFNKSQGGGEDPEPESPVYGGTIYRGTLQIYMAGDMENDITEGNGRGNVHIISTGDDQCTFVLPNFSLTLDGTEFPLGDILVENVTLSRDGAKTNYTGSKEGMELSLGGDPITCNVSITGFTEGDHAQMEIAVDWIMDPDAGEDGIIPITVYFNGITYGGTVYDGSLQIYMADDMENDITEGTGKGKVHIIKSAENTCTFVLPDFTLYLDGTPFSLGDIVVENVTMSTSGTKTNYTGYKEGMELSLGGDPIVCNVTLSGDTDADGHAFMEILVDWIMDKETTIPITVYFNGERDLTGIDEVSIDNTNAPVLWYNIQGMRVNGDNLPAGIYIRRQGTEVNKILIK